MRQTAVASNLKKMDILKKIDDVIYQEGFETKLTENDIEWNGLATKNWTLS
ncbi:hypothetical protein [Mesonia aquimarina]|uniref:hypothetical protein n=1 Tax=Mesonia aquimarina TaxID=1504967 RepID=UPI0013CF2A8F|nr:hypothetical protein [Mesonia aquimarina]